MCGFFAIDGTVARAGGNLGKTEPVLSRFADVCGGGALCLNTAICGLSSSYATPRKGFFGGYVWCLKACCTYFSGCTVELPSGNGCFNSPRHPGQYLYRAGNRHSTKPAPVRPGATCVDTVVRVINRHGRQPQKLLVCPNKRRIYCVSTRTHTSLLLLLLCAQRGTKQKELCQVMGLIYLY